MHEQEVSARPIEVTAPEGMSGGAPGAPGRVAPRRRARGPRPVRPGVVPVGVRPAEVERPRLARRVPVVELVRRAEPLRTGPRLLARRRVALPLAGRARRMLAGLAVTAAAAVVVVALGLLAGVATQARGTAQPAGPAAGVTPVTVTVEAEATVWDLARRFAPASAGPELAAVAERIVTDNSLETVQLRPGQVLRVTSG